LVVFGVVGALALGVLLALRFSPEIRAVAPGTPAPAFTAVDLRTGEPRDIQAYSGQVVLINVWATWCQPCRVEMPSMQRAYETLKARGFRIAAVSIDAGNPEPVLAFADELGLSFDVLHDPDGSIQRVYQTTGVPESWVVDKYGVIVKKIIGAHEWDTPANLALLERLLDDDG
jgi:peroxiredoxin